jgi:hypothetical protein
LIQAANAAVKNKKSFYRAKYNHLKFRLGSANKAKVAIANHIARAVFHVIRGATYKDLGYIRVETQEHRIKKLIAKLKREGVDVKYHTHEKIIEAKSMVTIMI